MTQAAKTATEYARRTVRRAHLLTVSLADRSERHRDFNSLDETRDAIREAAGSVYESIRENIDPEIYDAYMEP